MLDSNTLYIYFIFFLIVILMVFVYDENIKEKEIVRPKYYKRRIFNSYDIETKYPNYINYLDDNATFGSSYNIYNSSTDELEPVYI